jgi:hypothetical protein
MNRFFTEMYARHLGKTLFFIAIGVSSSVGIHFIIKQFLNNDMYATIAAIGWAIVLVTIYSDGLANREYQYRLLTESFNFHRTLRPDNRIGAIVPVVPVVPKVEESKIQEIVEEEKSTKPEFSKIEIVHSMEPMSKPKEAKA